MSPPRVSVVVPCHNSERYLAQTIESVLGQQEAPAFEILMVDDASTDGTLALAREIAAADGLGRIRVIGRDARGGVAAARNTGIAAAAGRDVLPLDADDLLSPTFLRDATAALDADEATTVAAPDRNDFGDITGRWPPGPMELPRLRYFNQLPYACLYRRTLWERVGGYRSNVDGFDDWNFWIAAARMGARARHATGATLLHRRRRDSFMWRLVGDFERLHARIVLNEPSAFEPGEVAAADALLQQGTPASFLSAARMLYLGRYYAAYDRGTA